MDWDWVGTVRPLSGPLKGNDNYKPCQIFQVEERQGVHGLILNTDHSHKNAMSLSKRDDNIDGFRLRKRQSDIYQYLLRKRHSEGDMNSEFLQNFWNKNLRFQFFGEL